MDKVTEDGGKVNKLVETTSSYITKDDEGVHRQGERTIREWFTTDIAFDVRAKRVAA
jgi:hypothetical protein